MGCMGELKKISLTEVERVLMADADNIDAWDAPITVPPTAHEETIRELEQSDSWVKLNGRDEPRG